MTVVFIIIYLPLTTIPRHKGSVYDTFSSQLFLKNTLQNLEPRHSPHRIMKGIRFRIRKRSLPFHDPCHTSCSRLTRLPGRRRRRSLACCIFELQRNAPLSWTEAFANTVQNIVRIVRCEIVEIFGQSNLLMCGNQVRSDGRFRGRFTLAGLANIQRFIEMSARMFD